jgi:8-oxo-dGTP diphosphatase
MNEIVRVGVGVLLLKDTAILLGKRKNAHGEGAWGPPGGKLEFGESFIECAQREVFEETGLHIPEFFQGPITNDIFTAENKHYVSIFMLAQWRAGEPCVMETDKCEKWQWCQWNNLPAPLFLPLENLVKIGFNPFAEPLTFGQQALQKRYQE